MGGVFERFFAPESPPLEADLPEQRVGTREGRVLSALEPRHAFNRDTAPASARPSASTCPCGRMISTVP